MQTIKNLFKKFGILSLIIGIVVLMMIWIDGYKSGTLPQFNAMYVVYFSIAIFAYTIAIFITLILFDFLIIQPFKYLFSDYKNSDSTGKIILIISVILVLSRKIYMWTS